MYIYEDCDDKNYDSDDNHSLQTIIMMMMMIVMIIIIIMMMIMMIKAPAHNAHYHSVLAPCRLSNCPEMIIVTILL